MDSELIPYSIVLASWLGIHQNLSSTHAWKVKHVTAIALDPIPCQPLDSSESHSHMLRRVLVGPADTQNCNSEIPWVLSLFDLQRWKMPSHQSPIQHKINHTNRSLDGSRSDVLLKDGSLGQKVPLLQHLICKSLVPDLGSTMSHKTHHVEQPSQHGALISLNHGHFSQEIVRISPGTSRHWESTSTSVFHCFPFTSSTLVSSRLTCWVAHICRHLLSFSGALSPKSQEDGIAKRPAGALKGWYVLDAYSWMLHCIPSKIENEKLRSVWERNHKAAS